MLNECLHLLGDGAFLREDKELTYEEHKNKKTKSSCERKFKVGDIVTGVNPTQLSIYQRVFKIIDYDEILKAYILENALGYKEEDLELYVEKSMAKKRFSVGNFIAVANSKLENYNKVLRIVEINGNNVKLSDGSVVFWTDMEMFQREETKSSCEDDDSDIISITTQCGKSLSQTYTVKEWAEKTIKQEEKTKSSCEDKKSLSLDDIERMRYKKGNKVKNSNVSHYDIWNGFEAIDVMKLSLTDEEYVGYLKGNILKYQLRLGKKDDVSKEIVKIKDYQNELNSILKDK